MSKLPNFTLARRAQIERESQRIARQALADLTRFAIRAEHQARLTALHVERAHHENVAAIGAALAKLNIQRWKQALLSIDIRDPEFLDRRAALSNAQLRRFLVEEVPAELAQSEDVARAIETSHVPESAVGRTADPPPATRSRTSARPPLLAPKEE